MPYITHSIIDYSYVFTLAGGDTPVKMQLLKAGATNTSPLIKVCDILFAAEGTVLPPANISPSLQSAVLYMSMKDLPNIIDLLRNEKPINLTFNPPFAFLGSSFEPVGDGDK